MDELEIITMLVYSETLYEISEDGTLYEIDDRPKQYVGYRDPDLLDEHLEMEWNKNVYDGEFDNDYDIWKFVAHTDVYDEDDDTQYKGFERIFKTDDGKQVVYRVNVETLIVVG